MFMKWHKLNGPDASKGTKREGLVPEVGSFIWLEQVWKEHYHHHYHHHHLIIVSCKLKEKAQLPGQRDNLSFPCHLILYVLSVTRLHRSVK